MKKTLLLLLTTLSFTIITHSQTIPEGVYIIRSSIDNHYVIDLSSSKTQNGNNIQIWHDNGTKAQRWKVTHHNGAITIRSMIDSNYAIDLNQSEAKEGNNIQIWLSNGTDAQRWYPKYDNGGYILCSAIKQNYVIDLNNSNTNDGTNIHLWLKNGTKAQRWIFERVYESNSNQAIVNQSKQSGHPQSQQSNNNNGNSQQIDLYNLTIDQQIEWMRQAAQNVQFNFDFSNMPVMPAGTPPPTTNTNSSYNSSSTSKSSSNQTAYDLQNKQMDQRAYEGYADMLMNMCYGRTTYNDSNRLSYQKTMRDLRMKWVNKGSPFVQSQWETWNGSRR